jgi:hypothetical protein
VAAFLLCRLRAAKPARTALSDPSCAYSQRTVNCASGMDSSFSNRSNDATEPGFTHGLTSFRDQLRVSEIEAPLNWLSALMTTDCLLPLVLSEILAEKPGALATT